MQRLSGIILLIGIVIAFYGESRPVIGEVFSTPDLQVQLDAIAADPGSWQTGHTLIGVAGIVVAIGLLVFAIHIQSISTDAKTRTAAYIATGAAMIGALGLAYSRYLILQSWEEAVNNGGSLLAPIAWLVGIIITGIVLLRTGYPKWLSWLVIIGSVTSLLGPPLFIYIPLLVMSIVLLVKSPPQLTLAEPTTRTA